MTLNTSIYRVAKEAFIEGAREQAKRFGAQVGERDREYFEKMWVKSDASTEVAQALKEDE